MPEPKVGSLAWRSELAQRDGLLTLPPSSLFCSLALPLPHSISPSLSLPNQLAGHQAPRPLNLNRQYLFFQSKWAPAGPCEDKGQVLVGSITPAPKELTGTVCRALAGACTTPSSKRVSVRAKECRGLSKSRQCQECFCKCQASMAFGDEHHIALIVWCSVQGIK